MAEPCLVWDIKCRGIYVGQRAQFYRDTSFQIRTKVNISEAAQN